MCECVYVCTNTFGLSGYTNNKSSRTTSISHTHFTHSIQTLNERYFLLLGFLGLFLPSLLWLSHTPVLSPPPPPLHLSVSCAFSAVIIFNGVFLQSKVYLEVVVFYWCCCCCCCCYLFVSLVALWLWITTVLDEIWLSYMLPENHVCFHSPYVPLCLSISNEMDQKLFTSYEAKLGNAHCSVSWNDKYNQCDTWNKNIRTALKCVWHNLTIRFFPSPQKYHTKHVRYSPDKYTRAYPCTAHAETQKSALRMKRDT